MRKLSREDKDAVSVFNLSFVSVDIMVFFI